MDAEVIVVGGGPAGSAAAALLARAGHDVLLVDRARFPRDKACAEYLSPATADALARLGVLAAVEATRPARPYGMRLSVCGHGAALVRYPHPSGPRRALCLSRRVLDDVLLRHARSCGAQVIEGWQAHEVRLGQAGAAIDGRPVERAAAARETLSARVVIGADGSRSVVSRQLELDRAVRWPCRTGLVAHFVDVPGAAALSEQGEILIGRGAYCGFAPQPDGAVNVAVVADNRLVARRGPGARASLPSVPISRIPGAGERLRGATRVGAWRGVAPLARRVSRVTGAGFLLLGDAAGFLDPLTGEGVYRALRGAELAAEVLDGALRRENGAAASLTAEALEPFAALRRTEFAAKETLCWVIQGLLAWPPLLAYALRRLTARPAAADLLGAVLGDYRPAAQALEARFLWSLLRP